MIKGMLWELLFEVEITDSNNYFEINVIMFAGGSRMAREVKFNVSYTPTVDWDSFRIIIVIAESLGMILIFIGVSNAFQTNFISDLRKIVYVSLTNLYLIDPDWNFLINGKIQSWFSNFWVIFKAQRMHVLSGINFWEISSLA